MEEGVASGESSGSRMFVEGEKETQRFLLDNRRSLLLLFTTICMSPHERHTYDTYMSSTSSSCFSVISEGRSQIEMSRKVLTNKYSTS